MVDAKYEEVREGGLVVEATPQVSVELVDYVDIEITVAEINDNFSGVNTDTIRFPASCGREVAKAILALLKQQSKKSQKQ